MIDESRRLPFQFLKYFGRVKLLENLPGNCDYTSKLLMISFFFIRPTGNCISPRSRLDTCKRWELKTQKKHIIFYV